MKRIAIIGDDVAQMAAAVIGNIEGVEFHAIALPEGDGRSIDAAGEMADAPTDIKVVQQTLDPASFDQGPNDRVVADGWVPGKADEPRGERE